MKNKFPRCPDCGEAVELVARPGRTREIKRGYHAPIPEGYLLPECIKCGEPSMSLEESEPLDALLSRFAGLESCP